MAAASFFISSAVLITLSSCVPAWVTHSVAPSAVQATPQGFAAPASTSSSSTVLSSLPAARSRMLARFGVHPPAFELGRRQLVARQQMHGVRVLSVRRHADAAQTRAAVQQTQRLNRVIRRIDHVHDTGHVKAVGPVQGEMIRDHDELAVRGRGGVDRFADHGQPRDFFLRLDIDHGHVVVETIADVQLLALGSDA